MNKIRLLKNRLINSAAALGVAAFILAAGGAAQAASFAGTYSQNFDGMGTGTTLPTDWSVYTVGSSHSAWVSSITANGASDSVQAMTLSTTQVASALTDTSLANTKGTSAYNIAHAGDTGNRVLSTSPSGNDGTALQLLLTNTSGATINGLNVSYNIVKFSDGTQQGSIVDSGQGWNEELPGYQLFYSVNGGTWVNVAALNPVRDNQANPNGNPVIPVGTVAAAGTYGNLDYSVTSITNSLVTLATGWGTGQTLALRWVDDNAENVSPDQIIGLDNVNVSSVPIPGAVWLLGSGLVGLVGIRRRMQK